MVFFWRQNGISTIKRTRAALYLQLGLADIQETSSVTLMKVAHGMYASKDLHSAACLLSADASSQAVQTKSVFISMLRLEHWTAFTQCFKTYFQLHVQQLFVARKKGEK